MEIEITFAGDLKIDARIGDHLIQTDQAKKRGGEGAAPEPFQLFLTSVGTCAAVYVLRFCQSRGIPTDGIKLVQRHVVDTMSASISEINIEVQVPPEFPEKYHDAVVRAADKCAVKIAIFDPPEINIRTVQARSSEAET